MMAKHFGCTVHAFDPSPITQKWFPKSGLDKLPNYFLHSYGAGNVDGDVVLKTYDWQVG